MQYNPDDVRRWKQADRRFGVRLLLCVCLLGAIGIAPCLPVKDWLKFFDRGPIDTVIYADWDEDE